MIRDPPFVSYVGIRENHDTQQIPQIEVTLPMAHPTNHEARMMMQENIAIAPEIATEQK